MGSLAKITPRWLTRRLRELQDVGVVEKEVRAGRRESWYTLTPAGRDLLPVIDALLNWGLRHAMRPPAPGEVVNPELMMRGLTRTLNNKQVRLTGPATWLMKFPRSAYALCYDGERWTSREEDTSDAEVVITTTPENWARVSTLGRSERQGLLKTMHIKGREERVSEFGRIFGMETHSAPIEYP
jgi:DNA-binding MarR family transcriptional regulator